MSALGRITLWLTLVFALWGGVVAVLGWQRRSLPLMTSARRGTYAVLGIALAATLSLLTGLWRHDFGMAYVHEVSSLTATTGEALAGVLGAPGGSLLVWIVLVATVAAVAQSGGSPTTQRNRAAVAGAAAGVMAVAAMAALWTAPFARLPYAPVEGLGLAPRLRTAAFPIHTMAALTGAALGAVATVLLRVGRRPAALMAGRFAWMALTAAVAAASARAYLAGPEAAARAWMPRDGLLLSWLLVGAALAVVRVRGGGAHGCRLLAVGAASTLVVLFTLPNAGAPRATSLGLSVPGWLMLGMAVALAALGTFHRYPSAVGHPRAGARRIARAVEATGIVCAAVAALALWAGMRATDKRLRVGEDADVTGMFGARYRLVHLDVSQFQEIGQFVVAASARVAGGGGGGGGGGGAENLVTSARTQWLDAMGRPVGEVVPRAGLRGGWLEDLRVTFEGRVGATMAAYRLETVPLARWWWIGLALVVAGTGAAAVQDLGSRVTEGDDA